MIINKSLDNPLIIEGGLSSKNYSLEAKSAEHIMEILRESIYTNPILAIIREYWANAMDSVKIANKNLRKDVIITLPTKDNPVFSVEDFGLGLSESEVYKYYTQYGASVKRDSNEVVGCLGIGCKSAFAYKKAETFTLIATKNNIKRTFIATNTSSGSTLVKVDETLTDNCNGVLISIPVDPNDIDRFHDLCYDFFEFVPELYLPIIKNGKYGSQLKKQHKFSWAANNETNINFYYLGASYICMGGIPYFCCKDSVLEAIKGTQIKMGEFEKMLMTVGLCFEVPIGAVEFAVSREEIRYTEKTATFICEAYKLAATCINDYFNKLVSEKYREISCKDNLFELSEIIALVAKSCFCLDEPGNNESCFKHGLPGFHFTYKTCKEETFHYCLGKGISLAGKIAILKVEKNANAQSGFTKKIINIFPQTRNIINLKQVELFKTDNSKTACIIVEPSAPFFKDSFREKGALISRGKKFIESLFDKGFTYFIVLEHESVSEYFSKNIVPNFRRNYTCFDFKAPIKKQLVNPKRHIDGINKKQALCISLKNKSVHSYVKNFSNFVSLANHLSNTFDKICLVTSYQKFWPISKYIYNIEGIIKLSESGLLDICDIKSLKEIDKVEIVKNPEDYKRLINEGKKDLHEYINSLFYGKIKCIHGGYYSERRLAEYFAILKATGIITEEEFHYFGQRFLKFYISVYPFPEVEEPNFDKKLLEASQKNPFLVLAFESMFHNMGVSPLSVERKIDILKNHNLLNIK